MAAGLTAAGCAATPHLRQNPSFEQNIATKERDGVVVSVAVLTDAEAEEYFGCPLGSEGIQAVWLRVRNTNDYPIGLLSRSMDPEYFSALEVSYLFHGSLSDEANRNLDEFFHREQFPAFVEPKETETGFVFTSRQEGAKFVNVEFWHAQGLTRDGFFMKLPTGGFDFHEADFGKIYRPDQIRNVDLAALHGIVETLPCCTTDRSGAKQGDPVNFVMVGREEDVLGALTQQGWDPTHTVRSESIGRTISSFLFGAHYRYAPVSRLYYFGRGQDLAMQKVRDTIHQRNHLRLWRSPYMHDGREVWIGQISRDIGVRFTLKSSILLTHKIDPEVDEARDYLVQDMITSGFLSAMGYARGVGTASRSSPRENLTGDIYFTDGLRAVMFISSQPVPMNRINLIEWGEPLPTE
jgi:hypothetical protein